MMIVKQQNNNERTSVKSPTIPYHKNKTYPTNCTVQKTLVAPLPTTYGGDDPKRNVNNISTYTFTKSQVTQPAITCSKLTIETLEQGVKYVQS